MSRPRTLLGKLLDADGREPPPASSAPAPRPFHARIAKFRVGAKSFAPTGIAKCRTCGFQCDAFSYLVIVRRLSNAREELARAGAVWIEKVAKDYTAKVGVPLAFAGRLRRQPERRHILLSSAVPAANRSAVDWTSKRPAWTWPENCARLRPKVVRIAPRGQPGPHTARGYRRDDILRAAQLAGLPTG